jgi:hypothetical protein
MARRATMANSTIRLSITARPAAMQAALTGSQS